MATADQQATDTAAGQKQADADAGNVEVGKQRLVPRPQEQRQHREDRNFMMVVDDLLFAGDDLRRHHKTEECNDYNRRHP